MNTIMRPLVVCVLFALVNAAAVWSQEMRAAPAPAAGQCTNNLKMLGYMIWNQTNDQGVLTAGQHRAELCAASGGPQVNVIDGSNIVLVRELSARLSGCPADLDDFGEGAVRTRALPDGRTELTMVSRKHRGCTATALMPASYPALLGVPTPLEPSQVRVAPRLLAEFRGFWRELDAAEGAALERRLAALAGRARTGANVERELNQVVARYPRLQALSKELDADPPVLVAPGGEPWTCYGYSYVNSKGELVCIGVLTDG